MLDLHTKLAVAETPDGKTRLQGQINATDREIDELCDVNVDIPSGNNSIINMFIINAIGSMASNVNLFIGNTIISITSDITIMMVGLESAAQRGDSRQRATELQSVSQGHTPPPTNAVLTQAVGICP